MIFARTDFVKCFSLAGFRAGTAGRLSSSANSIWLLMETFELRRGEVLPT
jgi:hypothetical protein